MSQFSTDSLSRRDFLKNSALGAGILASTASGIAMAAPGNRITLGCIGVGGHGGGYNLPNFLKIPDAQVVAVCDVFDSRANAAKKKVDDAYGNKDCKTYSDFREVLARSDIDAVVISTPDHWHVSLSILAAKAGKDVFCEKPTLTIEQGQALIKVVKQTNVIYQGGIEDRSVDLYHRLAELVRNGVLGKLEKIQVALPPGDLFPKEEVVPVPKGFDYEMWLGPAPHSPFTPTKTGAQEWRNHFDYSGGKLTDWGAHLMDTAQVALFEEHGGPIAVDGKGEFPTGAMSNTALKYTIKYTYRNDVTMTVKSGGTGIAFYGSDGWAGSKSWREPLVASDPEILKAVIDLKKNKMYPIPVGEHQAFIDGVKSRKMPYYSPEDIHRLSSAMHLGNISMLLDRKLEWNPRTEEFVDDGEANAMRSKAGRGEWALEQLV